MLGTCRGIEERPAEPDLFDMLDKAWKTWQNVKNVNDDGMLVVFGASLRMSDCCSLDATMNLVPIYEQQSDILF